MRPTCGATTGRPRGRRSRASRAIACASTSPTSSPSTRASTGMAGVCPTAWMGWADSISRRFRSARPTCTSSRQADGTFMYHPHADEMVQIAMGKMGFWVTHPREPKSCRWTATTLPVAHLRGRSRHVHAEDQDHGRLQPVHLQQPRVPRHRSPRAAPGRSRPHPHRQPHDVQSPNPHSWGRVRGDRHRRGVDPQRSS